MQKWMRWVNGCVGIISLLSLHTGHASENTPQQRAEQSVAHFIEAGGCVPNISLAGSLCSLICCPCCAPCMALNLVQEVCTCPSTRRIRNRESARTALNHWRTFIQTQQSRGMIEYNGFVDQHRNSTNPRGNPLFDNDRDCMAFLIEDRAGGQHQGHSSSIDQQPPAYSVI